MVVEHSFVTTLEAEPALATAAELLQLRGFTRAALVQGAPGSAPFEMRRGKKAASSARSVSQLPQTVRLYWDRGRVTIALSIEANSVWGGQSSWGATVEKPEKMQMHADLLSGIAVALEQVLAHAQPHQVATAQWDRAETEIAAAAKRRNRNVFIMVGVFLVIVTALATLAVMKA